MRQFLQAGFGGGEREEGIPNSSKEESSAELVNYWDRSTYANPHISPLVPSCYVIVASYKSWMSATHRKRIELLADRPQAFSDPWIQCHGPYYIRAPLQPGGNTGMPYLETGTQQDSQLKHGGLVISTQSIFSAFGLPGWLVVKPQILSSGHECWSQICPSQLANRTCYGGEFVERLNNWFMTSFWVEYS